MHPGVAGQHCQRVACRWIALEYTAHSFFVLLGSGATTRFVLAVYTAVKLILAVAARCTATRRLRTADTASTKPHEFCAQTGCVVSGLCEAPTFLVDDCSRGTRDECWVVQFGRGTLDFTLETLQFTPETGALGILVDEICERHEDSRLACQRGGGIAERRARRLDRCGPCE